MPEGYLHLTCEQRCQIYALLCCATIKVRRRKGATIRMRMAPGLTDEGRA